MSLTREVRENLEREITRLQELLERLSDSGTVMSERDMRTLRHVFSGTWFAEMNEEAEFMFRKGHLKDLIRNRDHLIKILKALTE